MNATPSTYVHAWPVLDQDRTLAELRAEAEPLLEDVVVERGLWPVADPVWSLRDDVLWPDCPAGTCLLCVRLPVVTLEQVGSNGVRYERFLAEQAVAEERALRRAEAKRAYKEREREADRERLRRRYAADRARAAAEPLAVAG